MPKNWVFPRTDPETRDRLARDLGLSPLLAQLVVNRGVGDRAAAETFLWPKLTQLHEPELLPDMAKATDRVRRAVREQEKIVIYGDYDVDGTTGAAVLLKFFEQLNYPAEAYIPHRIEEGYGLNLGAVKELLADGMQLLITVDCGSRAVEEVQYLQQQGVDVIVTDHHDVGDALPDACAVINPKRTGSQYPFTALAGAGVAFKLAWALSQAFSEAKKVSPAFRAYLLHSLGYVALGTVADVVPLVGENRIITRFGLTALRDATTAGIKALKDCARIGDQRLSSTDVSFKIAPRLNAAGRMGHARDTLDLLTTEDPTRADELASAIEEQNVRRKELGKAIFEEAEAQVQEHSLAEQAAIVVGGKDWHVGVLGIVAARIVDAHWRPCLAISLNGSICKGSARSIPPYHITDALSQCADLLISYGGHAQAAGVRMEQSQFEALRERLVEHAGGSLSEADFVPALQVDAEVLLAQLTPEALSELQMLEPYGESNPEPVLVAANATVAGSPRIMGADGSHISFYVRQGETSLRVVAFNQARKLSGALANGVPCSVAFSPQINEFRGSRSVELRLLDIDI